MKTLPEPREMRSNPMKPNSVRASRYPASDTVAAPSRLEARRRIQSKPGFFASLSPEAWAAIEGHDGPEAIGPARRR